MNNRYTTLDTPHPSGIGYRIIHDHDDGCGDTLIDLALAGFHNNNPYHNVTHELQAVYYSNAAYLHSDEYNQSDAKLLSIAALFHDHNHSGGMYKDDVNIEVALDAVNRLMNSWVCTDYMSDTQLETVCDIIRCTTYMNGRFPIEPKNILERCMRDADLCSIYSPEGQQLLHGLPVELNVANPKIKPLHSMETREEIDEYLKHNADFLRLAPMYTDYGNRLKEYQLESALAVYAGSLQDLPYKK